LRAFFFCHCEELTPPLRSGVGHARNFDLESQYNLSLRAKRSNLAPVPAREIATAFGLAMTHNNCFPSRRIRNNSLFDLLQKL